MSLLTIENSLVQQKIVNNRRLSQQECVFETNLHLEKNPCEQKLTP